ncbi:hypothetical protein [Methanopyrus kandleri]|uniref:Uncharacterized protein n=2 Tax=Methanopyrus kandleri TaxID=2320 RepID=Q8TXP6_METKA|nr:hypothetical protein [Methanopyrus kandleri]AAM01829.1 Uncharacterized protein MK0614 [Methanopyrus kandleri AV19]HII70163.1 hypothetical protein [Methanopyrus kandleri]
METVRISVLDVVRRIADVAALSVFEVIRDGPLDVLGCTVFNIELARRLVNKGLDVRLVSSEVGGPKGLPVVEEPASDTLLVTEPLTFYSEYHLLRSHALVLMFRYGNPGFKECLRGLDCTMLLPEIEGRPLPDLHTAFVAVLQEAVTSASEGHHVVGLRVSDTSDYFIPNSDPAEVKRRDDAIVVRAIPPYRLREGRVWEAVARAVDQVRFRRVSRCFQK